MEQTSRENLIKISGNEALSELLALWEGVSKKNPDEFTSETGEDYEQCLVDYLISLKFKIEESLIPKLVGQLDKDKQFYELAHLLLFSEFSHYETKLNKTQLLVLDSLYNNSALWAGDGDLELILKSLGLPTTRTNVRGMLGKYA